MSGSSATIQPRRGEVYLLDFAPATGHELTDEHPCVIVQNDVGNTHSALTIVAAVTSNLRLSRLPICVFVPAGEGGLRRDSIVNCGHVYTVDQARLISKLGTLSTARLQKVDAALATSFNL